MLWFLILLALCTAGTAMLAIWRFKEDAEYERTRRTRDRWWDF